MKTLNWAYAVTLATVSLQTLCAGLANAQNQQAILEEVIVTANKRAESIQDVSGSITALSGDMVREANITDFFDMADMTPSMTQQSEGNVTIRGIGRTDGTDAFASAVAIHENGFFLPDATAWPLIDMGAVEITRGPAGTVFGRNATGGTINSKWAEPKDEWGFGVDVTYGSYNQERLRGHVNAPLVADDLLNARFSFIRNERDGYTENSLTPDNRDGGAKDEWLWRIYTASELTDNLTIRLRYMNWYRDNVYIYGLPDRETRDSDFYERVGAQDPPEELFRVRANVLDKQGGRPGWNRARRIAGDINWVLEDLPLLGNIDVDFLYGENRSKDRLLVDIDGTETDIALQNASLGAWVRNGELRFSSQNQGAFNWMGGVFWTRFYNRKFPSLVDARVPVSSNTLLGATAIGNAPLELPETEVIVRAHILTTLRERTTKSQALFSNFSLNLQQLFSETSGNMPNIEIFGGYRLNYDDMSIARIVEQDIYAPADSPEPALSSREQHAGKTDFEEDTWELGAKWFINNDHMLYVKAAKGYKAGTLQIDGVLNSVEPEILLSYELGLKSTWLNGAMQLNTTAYLYDYTDLQVLFRENLETRTENAAGAEVWGIESDLQWQASQNLFMMLSVAYSDSEFTDYCSTDPAFPQGFTDPGCEAGGGEQDLSGNSLPNSPNLSASTMIRYTFNLGDLGSFEPFVRANYADAFNAMASGHPRYEVDSITKTDLHLMWRSADGKLTVDAYVQHIEDNQEITLLPITIGVEGVVFNLSHAPPRTAGLNIRYEY